MGFYAEAIFPRVYDWLIDAPHWAKHRTEQLAAVEGDILEIGVGTGLNLPCYPADVQKITTVEPSEGMNKLLRKRIAATGIEVDQRILGGEALPFNGETFDCVVSTVTLCSIPQVQQAMSELLRVLRPGGRFFFLEHGRSPDLNIYKWQRRFNGLQKHLVGGCRLDVDIRGLIESRAFSAVSIKNFYMEKMPKTHGYMYHGVAIK
ncbi:MAG: class I SAM-dependent methyltransferase [Pirellulales bacterium]|nr:class I SAM-dependent methyltransferase [Pirellulales bacterium]